MAKNHRAPNRHVPRNSCSKHRRCLPHAFAALDSTEGHSVTHYEFNSLHPNEVGLIEIAHTPRPSRGKDREFLDLQRVKVQKLTVRSTGTRRSRNEVSNLATRL